MKTLLIVLLCASLTANAVLFVRTLHSRPHAVSNSTLQMPAVPAPAAGTERGVVPAKIAPEIAQLLLANDPEAIHRLRALGYSEKALRAIASAQVAAQFRDRYRALEAATTITDFWKAGYHTFNFAAAAARLDLQREQEVALKKLLGNDYTPEPGPWAMRYGNLPPAKLARVRAIEGDYQSMMMGVRGNSMMSYIQFPEDEEKLKYLRKEEREELKQTLSPEELLEYDLRTSPTAASLRSQLSAFDTSEQEFRDLFKIREEVDARANLDPFDFSNATQNARAKAATEFNDRVKALLPADRYAEYQLANDFDYKRFYQIATRLDLPRESAAAAEAVKTSTEEKRVQLMRDPTLLAPDKRTDALDQLSGEAEARLRRILGDSGYEAYRASPNNFLQRLRPRPRPMRKS